MKTICLSSSLRFKGAIRETMRRFGEMGITALFPNLDCGPDKDKLDMETMRRLCQDHFQAIDHSETLYVDVIKGFAGDDAELAKYYPEDKDFLLEFEPAVVHYEIVGQS